MSIPPLCTVTPGARGPRGAGSNAHKWLLAETLTVQRGFVVADGANPRGFTRLARSWLGRSATLAPFLLEIIDACASSAQDHLRTVNSSAGQQMRIVAVPVADSTDRVFGVHVWGGPGAHTVPPRPAVGTLDWDSRTRLITTDAVLEGLLGSGADTGRSRALPEFLRLFEQFDRLGLMSMFDPDHAPSTWSTTAVSGGPDAGHRRHLALAARNETSGSSVKVRALVHDISSVVPAPPSDLGALLTRAAPRTAEHALGIMDLRTGVIHEWHARGQDPLHRLLSAVPHIHPEDTASCTTARASLLAGQAHQHNEFRVTFDHAQWHRVRADWTVLTRETAPQAMLSVQLLTSDT